MTALPDACCLPRSRHSRSTASLQIYASGNSEIPSVIGGSAGLTTFGPGAVTLWADNAQTLSGPVIVSGGTLVAGGSAQPGASATGAGHVRASGGATLKVKGGVAGAVTVDGSGMLFMNGGTVAGPATIGLVAPPDSDKPAPPVAVLQGGGTIAGAATLYAALQSEAQGACLLSFTGGLTTEPVTSFTWRLQSLIDSTSGGQPGVDWNAVQIGGQGGSFGTTSAGVTYYLDFSALPTGDPDNGDPFWQTARLWPLVLIANSRNTYCYDKWGNFA